jgi:RNA polymerase sigma-70 factor (ECF subfamily)
MRNREDAEDVVQDCLLKAFAHVKDFDERSQFATWLTRIAINAALSNLRKNHWKREIPIDASSPPSEPGRHWEIPDDAPDPEETYSLGERRQILNAAVLRLRPRLRTVVEIHQLQEHSIIGTAQMLGISNSAVKARIIRARLALHRMSLLQSAGGRGSRRNRQIEIRRSERIGSAARVVSK